jgi:toxin secretion/phage lysis holin
MERLDLAIKGATAAVGWLVGYLYGGWSAEMGILLAVVIADYFSGLMASAYEGRLSSKIGFKGIPKKVMIFFMVGVAHWVDILLNTGEAFKTATILFYFINELISITENAGRMGIPVPDKLQQAIDILKSKSNQRGEK